MTESRVRDILAESYGLRPHTITRIAAMQSFYVSSDTQEFVFKRHPDHAVPNRAQLERLYGALGEARLCPAVAPSAENVLLPERDGRMYSLSHRVFPQEHTPAPDAMGRWLARLHDALAAAGGAPMRNHFARALPDLSAVLARHGLQKHAATVSEAETLLRDGPLQTIHGDLHAGNILFTPEGPLAIDLDSATHAHPGLDVGFAAYRLYGADPKALRDMVQGYVSQRDRTPLAARDAARLVVFAVAQRIAYILKLAARGDTQWLYDLEPQRRHLEGASHLLHGTQLAN